MNCQMSKSRPNPLVAPQQPFLKASLYFDYRISMRTKGPISLPSDKKSYVYVIVGAFTHYVALHSSPRNDTANSLNVSFDHWIARIELYNIIVTDHENKYFNGEFAHFNRIYMNLFLA